jgi:hypothetical protein
MKKFTVISLVILMNLSFAYGKSDKSRLDCEKKCGDAPRLIDLPSKDDERLYEAEMARVVRYNQCIDKCNIREHLDERIKALSVQPTIDSLQKELHTCESQLAILQEKEPSVYDKLQREFKKIEENGGHFPNYYKVNTATGVAK